MGCTENQSQPEENEEERQFDLYILYHFLPFSGKQPVNRWLDDTESKFNDSRVSRNLRFEAISLLVESNAKRLYIKTRKEIRSFDDFTNSYYYILY